MKTTNVRLLQIYLLQPSCTGDHPDASGIRCGSFRLTTTNHPCAEVVFGTIHCGSMFNDDPLEILSGSVMDVWTTIR